MPIGTKKDYAALKRAIRDEKLEAVFEEVKVSRSHM